MIKDIHMKKNLNAIIVANRRERLQKWIDDSYGGSQAKYIEATGINQGELSGLLLKKSFGGVKARNIETQAGMPDFWLDKPHLHLESSTDNAVIAIDPSLIEIKQHDDVAGAMGHGVILNDQPGQITGWQVTMEWANKNIPSNTGNKNLRIVTGFGNSMKGLFNSGDPLLVDTGVKDVKHDDVYFFRVGDEGFIKLLQRVPGDGIRVISKNTDYETWTITEDMDFEVFGIVLKVWSGVEP